MEIPGLSIVPILFIVIIIVPGTFCKRFFFSGAFSSQFGSGVFADRLMTSIFWGFVINLISYILYSKALDFDLNDIKDHIRDAYEALASNKLPKNIDRFNLWMILGYMASSIVVAILSGILAHTIVRAFRLDLHFKVFRFSNHWHYYFTGEILRAEGMLADQTGKKVVATSADIVLDVEEDGRKKLFTGILSQYTLSPKGTGLETLILTDPRRFSHKINGFKEVKSHIMIIPYSRVVDINLRYEFFEAKESMSTEQESDSWAIVVVFSFALVIVLPWFFGLTFWTTLAGIFFLLISWLASSSILLFMLDDYRRKQMTTRRKWAIFAIAVASFLISFFILDLGTQLTSLIQQIKSNKL